jgi:hypothetical protein
MSTRPNSAIAGFSESVRADGSRRWHRWCPLGPAGYISADMTVSRADVGGSGVGRRVAGVPDAWDARS